LATAETAVPPARIGADEEERTAVHLFTPSPAHLIMGGYGRIFCMRIGQFGRQEVVFSNSATATERVIPFTKGMALFIFQQYSYASINNKSQIEVNHAGHTIN
jgi:hypothetical protein